MTTRIIVGDCREVLKTLPDRSIHACITSPPYYNLRDYGTAQWEGGDVGCDHVDKAGPVNAPSAKSTLTTNNGKGPQPGDKYHHEATAQYRNQCGKCGAVRVDQQIGLEASLDEYVTTLVEVFREVWRVLRDDGTVWLNLGDGFSSQGGVHKNGSYDGVVGRHMNGMARQTGGLKPKDLMMVPARVALALQADGWYLRSDIIWAKPNPMPESVTDRPTSSHEHVFLLTKRSRYFYDAEAVREPHKPESIERMKSPLGAMRDRFDQADPKPGNFNDYLDREAGWGNPNGRNLRNVWTIATRPYPDAHFATFPPALVEPCIKAGTSERGCCPTCGSPWLRVVERVTGDMSWAGRSAKNQALYDQGYGGKRGITLNVGSKEEYYANQPQNQTIGWQPSCRCDAGVPIPCTVLDPFGGAGTTALVADRLGRNAMLIELNEQYAELARRRLVGDAPLFAKVES